MISLFSPHHATLLARCHRRSALVDATEALRDALNATRPFAADPARLLDTPHNAATEFVLTHNGARYRLTMRPDPEVTG